MKREEKSYESQNFRVLIADDEPSIRNVLSDVLGSKEGYVVDTAVDGTEAIEKIRRAYYRIVFVDLRMPGADGITVVEELKRHSPDSTAVIIPAFGTISSAVEALPAGAYDYISKPFHLLENLVEQMGVVYQRGIIDVAQLPLRYPSAEYLPQLGLDALWLGEKIDINQLINTIECVSIILHPSSS